MGLPLPSSEHGAEGVRYQLTTVSIYGNRGPSTRVRVQDWIDHLGLNANCQNYASLPDAGLSTIRKHLPSVLAAEMRTRRLTRVKHERLMLSREASPFSRGEVESGILRGAAHGTYDFDDALFEDVEGWRRILAKDVKCRAGVEAADVVIAGNDYLANWASAYNDDVRVIPSCVEPTSFRVKKTWDIQAPPRLVWLGSGPTERYVEQIAPALREVNRLTGARLLLISARRDFEHPLLDGIVDRRQWSPETFADDLATGDIALAPLDSTPYSKGKCAYKLLQYAASGIPIVGSPVGANDVALARFGGTAVEDPGDWVEALLAMLAAGPEIRQAIGERSVAAVSKYYSFAAWASAWQDATGLT